MDTSEETTGWNELRAPFPFFGGKRRVADVVWSRFGNVATYNEPFAGSLAVLLGRPHAPRIETVNDLDSMIGNFWRALQHDPDEVAFFADFPVSEVELHSRHCWLVGQLPTLTARMIADPDFYDAKIAGCWCWGICLWIGSGWCGGPREHQKRPKLYDHGGAGVHHKRFVGPGNGQGAGVHSLGAQGREQGQRRWQGGGQGGGSGVHAPRLSQQIPELRGSRGATGSGVIAMARQFDKSTQGHGINAQCFDQKTGGLYVYMQQLATRLRRVRVCCGDWKRVLTPSVTTYIGTCGVFLDPPYSQDLRERCYSEDHDISAEVREWAIAHGDDPEMRIALCSYGEQPCPARWSREHWVAAGGYSRTERGKSNRYRETIDFSPHCLDRDDLFSERRMTNVER